MKYFKLRDLRHENLNAFLGCYVDLKTPSLVFEHASKGSLQVNYFEFLKVVLVYKYFLKRTLS